MPNILVLWPAPLPAPPLDGCELRGYATAAEVVAALGEAAGSVVLCSDGLAIDDLGVVAEALAAVDDGTTTIVEVQHERWDGETQSPVSAACAGVIAGFGPAGVAAAVALLTQEG